MCDVVSGRIWYAGEGSRQSRGMKEKRQKKRGSFSLLCDDAKGEERVRGRGGRG